MLIAREWGRPISEVKQWPYTDVLLARALLIIEAEKKRGKN